MPHRQTAVLFRAVAVAEAVSWAALLVAMFLKWVLVVDTPHEGGVPVAGRIHGALFMLYVAVALVAARTFRWNWKTALLALVAAVPPFATVVFERWATRRGMLDAGADAAGAPARG
ncbi:integral membrane protein [Kineococcus xinjiangensis]|uniref:Integral membrane protein n=1 Tax=Kineococcus xinjiangensis TaxID=512762 RepID=A0A2S6IV57_9ACTN|nr:DUF3817 domain-containing protein [Kineococcus xinjiangensis]PPK98162.1 integral membrane protein [Kineococcus xinjiangensis]